MLNIWQSHGHERRRNVEVSLPSPVNKQQLFTLQCCWFCVKEKRRWARRSWEIFWGWFKLRFGVKTSLSPPSAQQQYDVQDSLSSVRGIWQKFLPTFPPESKAGESVFVRLRSGAGYQKPGVQGEGWHASSRCKRTHQYTHDGRVPEESWR